MGRIFVYRLLTAVAVMSFAGFGFAYVQVDGCAGVYRALPSRPDIDRAGERLHPRRAIMPNATADKALAAAPFVG